MKTRWFVFANPTTFPLQHRLLHSILCGEPVQNIAEACGSEEAIIATPL
jgi:hypothetical protein